jgi:diacylglycerol kinase (ATP)
MHADGRNESIGGKNVKLIFNPNAGAARKKKVDLPDVLHELHKYGIEPDVCTLGTQCNLALELKTALADGIRDFVVCGGDGTVSSVADILAGTEARILIIPAGTQNNNARSLKIPADLPEATALLRAGRTVRVDAGVARCGGVITHFLEVVSVGLTSALAESGDDIQHGKVSGVGEFLSTLVTCPPSEISLTLDGSMRVKDIGHVALVTNMPYAGLHYRFGDDRCNTDGLLNVAFFSDLSKLDLAKYVSGGIHPGKREDPRIRHYLVQRIDIDTLPPMPVAADGRVIGEGSVHVELRRKAVGFIVGSEPELQADPS